MYQLKIFHLLKTKGVNTKSAGEGASKKKKKKKKKE